MVVISSTIIAQQPDTLQTANIEFITDQLENIAQSTDINLDYSDLIEDYLYYSKHPININGSDLSILRDIYLINDIQLNNINLYKQQFGQIFSAFELLSISGFNEEKIKQLQPFISFESEKQTEVVKIKDVLKYGKHVLLLRADRILERKKAFDLQSDSAINHPGSVYLGDPQHYYLRYSYKYKNRIRFGLTMDKDAGEVMFKAQLCDSLQNLIGKKVGYGYDFISAFAYAENIGLIKKIIVGDFHLEFGQGLTLWSGLTFGKSAEAISIKKFGRGIRPNTSANENRFFRGAAATISWKKLSLTSFFSSNNVDGNIIQTVYNERDGISSIIETGMHRTINELLDKNTLNIQVTGGNLSYQNNIFTSSITVYNTKLNKALIHNDETYKLFNFYGHEITNYGVDMSINFWNTNAFSELSGSSNGGIAGIVGLNMLLDERFFLTFIYHNYSKDYNNLYNNPFAESSSISNETGFYLGWKALIHSYISITGYIDHFKFPWLKYRVSSPSMGRDYLVQINISPKSDINSYIRYRFTNKQENFITDYDYMPKIEEINRHDFRFFISYGNFYNIILKNRIDIVSFQNKQSNNDFGYLLYQDILYRPISFPLEATFRFALFSTDSYNSRIYTYENDVLYAFSVPSYFNKGQRWYLMLKWKIRDNISMWIRFARTTYLNKETIGSGNDLIDGNSKSEIKIELKIKL